MLIDFLLNAISQVLFEFVVGIVGEFLFVVLDDFIYRRRGYPEAHARWRPPLFLAAGALVGLVSVLFVPHRVTQSGLPRLAVWLVMPAVSGALVSIFDGFMAPVDAPAARRVGFLSGTVFAVCYLLVRWLVLRELR